jgi:RNA polymerase sigma-70 factor (ECF subfamily)
MNVASFVTLYSTQRFNKEEHSVAERFKQSAALFSAKLAMLDRVMSSEPIDQLVRRAQQGDTRAVEALYQRYAQPVYRYIYYRVSTAADAEDLTAEVFIKVVEGLPSYRITGAPFEAWLYRIASARVIDHRRRKRRHPQAELMETLADHAMLPEEQIQQAQEIETLRRAFSQFSDEEQTLLILRFVERKSHQEAADVLGKSPAAVKSMQHRTLIKLAALLGSEEKVRHYLRGGTS